MQLEDSEHLEFPTPFLLIGERSKEHPAMNTSKQSSIYPLFIQVFILMLRVNPQLCTVDILLFYMF